MVNILQGLGQSQAISGYLQGISALRQQALQEKQGEQALKIGEQTFQSNEINLAKSKLDLAEAQKKEEFLKQTSDPNMSPVFAWMTPEQKKEWIGKLESAGFAQKVGNTASYVWTNRDIQNAGQMFSSNPELVKQFTSQRITNSQNEITGLQQQLEEAMAKGKSDEIPKLKQQLDSKLQMHNMLIGNYKPALEMAEFNASLIDFQQSNPEQFTQLMSDPKINMMFTLAKRGDEEARKNVYKILEAKKEEAALPYKIGEKVTFYQGGKKVQGTFQKLDEKGNSVFTDITTIPEKSDKPEYTPREAMNRMSQIKGALVRLDKSNTIDALMATINPNLASMINSTDPESIQAAKDQLQSEYDYVSRFAPKGYNKKITKEDKSKKKIPLSDFDKR